MISSTGCDINTLNAKRYSPLYVACEKNDDAIARRILTDRKFSRKLFQIPSVPQPLFAAVGNNHVHLVDLLIKTGCNINMVVFIFLFCYENSPLTITDSKITGLPDTSVA